MGLFETRIRDIYHTAALKPLEAGEIEDLNCKERCLLINKLAHAFFNNGNFFFRNDNVRKMLHMLGASFPVTEQYDQWAQGGEALFLNNLKARRNRNLLTGIGKWPQLNQGQKEIALKQLSQMYRYACLGTFPAIGNLEYHFRALEYRNEENGRFYTTYGSCDGSLNTGKIIITINSKLNELDNPFHAINTVLHETEHANHIQMAKLLPTHIDRQHSLREQAVYFYHLNRYRAFIPSSLQQAYEDQTHEFLATTAGEYLSAEILQIVNRPVP